MSAFEYNDLYLKCQNTGKYHMFIFDIFNSKKMDKNYRQEAQIKMIKLMTKIYETLKYIEKNSNKQILVFDDDFVTFESNKKFKGFGFKQEPFLLGDAFGFTIYRDSLDNKTIYDIYDYYKEELKIDFEFHLSDGYYETNDYSKGNTEYFRGHCIQKLSTLHKVKNSSKIKRLNRNI